MAACSTAGCLAATGTGCLAATGAWETTEIDGRKYVAAADLAEAYGMTPMPDREEPREIGFQGEEHSLIVKIDSRQAILDGARHWLSFDAKRGDDGEVRVSLTDVQSTVVPAFEPGSVKEIRSVKTVVFDPGHGGHDRGARSAFGTEKDYALDIVGRARRILEGRDIKVVQTRLSDFFVGLSQRPSMTKNYEDPVFVSIHLNAASWNPLAGGLEIYALPPSGAPSTGKPGDSRRDSRAQPGDPHTPASFLMANTIYHTLLGKMDGFDRGVKRARFSVLRHAKVPSVLIEGGFLTNPEEAKRINSPAWRDQFAEAIADGIEAYMKLANEGAAPPSAGDLGREPTDEFVPEY